MNLINIITSQGILKAEIYDTPTGSKIYDMLPVEGNANVWGDEIYFSINCTLNQETNAREEVEIGELGYWPVGNAFCIFFGPTPVSTSNKPRAYSPVNIFGKTIDNAIILKSVKQGEKIKIEKA